GAIFLATHGWHLSGLRPGENLGGLWRCTVAHGRRNADLVREKPRVHELSLAPTSCDSHRRWTAWHRPDVGSLLVGDRVLLQCRRMLLGSAQ
ncbi:hypothetical protein PanWU01x14_330870, partial [Parasponia andersonii]